MQVAIPRPSRHGPSRSGAVCRPRQPKPAAAVSYASRSFFDDQGRLDYTETTEYGLPRDTTTPARYGWLGSHRRNTGDALAQLTLMGARVYNPTSGRFLSVDPVPGGSCNDYDYTCADPVNGRDLDGKRCWRPSCLAKSAWRHRADIGRAVAVAALFSCTVCTVIAAGVAAYGAYQAYRAYRNHNYRSMAWELAGLATFGWGQRAARGYKYSVRAYKYTRGRYAAAHSRGMRRLWGGSSRYYSYRAGRYLRHKRWARWADYGHTTASSTYAYRNRAY